MEHGFDLNESVRKVQEIQKNNSLENIQKRHGCSLVEARDIQHQIYKNRSETLNKLPKQELLRIFKSQDSGSFEYCLKKCNYDFKLAEEMYQKLARKRCVPFANASKESLRYFIPLYKKLRASGILREDIYFGVDGSEEYFIYNKKSRKIYFYDFTILSKKIIIEYDGVYWHSDISSKNADLIKENLAKECGFKLFRIPSEIKYEQKQKIIQEVIDGASKT
jgi:hypothetical protein